MSLSTISPAEAKRLIDEGAVLVDVREADEHLRERIPGARNTPLSRLDQLGTGSRPVVFHCRSGGRTSANAGRLAAAAGTKVFAIEGGLDAWRRAGLPVERDERRPIEIMRQVQIAAGSLVLLGVVLGFGVNPVFYMLSGFIGAGLVFAGASGWCGMAKLLALMPWNRAAAQ